MNLRLVSASAGLSDITIKVVAINASQCFQLLSVSLGAFTCVSTNEKNVERCKLNFKGLERDFSPVRTCNPAMP